MCLLCSVPENNATEYAIPFRAVPWNNGNPFLHHITNGDASMDAFDEFSEELVMSLKEIFDNLREYKSISTKKEKLWCEFHRKRLRT